MKKYLIIATLAIGVIIGASALSAFATGTWTAPTATPPGGNVAAPINVGNFTQEKAAGLWLHGGLAVDGNLIVATGTPVAGKVLTAVDGTGLATWGTGSGGSSAGNIAIRYCTNAQSKAGGPLAVPECVAAAASTATTNPSTETWRPLSCMRAATYREVQITAFITYNRPGYSNYTWQSWETNGSGWFPWECVDGTLLIIKTR